MKPAWLKVVFIWVLKFVAAVDLTHWVLDRTLKPFDGPWDNVLHIILLAAPFLYLAACLWGFTWLVKWSSSTKFLSEGNKASIILIGLIAAQLFFTSLASIRSGSSSYHPLFPDFLGGILLAVATIVAGREHLSSRLGTVFVVLIAFLWLMGSVTVDLLWWTELTSRGVGPVWHLPLVAPLLGIICYAFIFGGGLFGMCLSFLGTIVKAPVIQPLWLLLLAVALAWCLRWVVPSRAWLKSLALAMSAVFLGYKAAEWSSFIAD